MEMQLSPELLIPELKKEIEKLKQELAQVHAEHVQSYNLNKNRKKVSNIPLESYNDLYRSIVETTNEGIWVSDVNFRTIFVNQKLADMLGYSKDEILSKSPFDFMDDEAVTLAKKYSEKSKQGYNDLYEQKYIRKDGSVLWTMLSASPIYDTHNNFTGILSLLTDITDRKRTENALQERVEKFSAAFRTNPYAIVLSHVEDGTIIEANNAFFELFERTEKEVIGKTSVSLNMFGNPEDREKAINLLRKEGRINNFEIKIKRRSGEERVAILSVEMLLISGSKTMLTTIQDITERKLSEIKIQELLKLAERKSAELHAVIESMPDAVYIGTTEGITQCNDTALKMLGAKSLKDLQERIGELGKKFNIRWPDSGRSLEVGELQFTRALKGETVIEEVLATNVQTGEDIYIRSADAPVIAKGEIIGAVAINSDITERKKTEEALMKANEQYELLFNSIEEGFAHYKGIYDENGRLYDLLVLEINPAGAKLSGIKRGEQIGKTWKQMWTGIEDHLFDIYREVDQKGEPLTFEHFSRITNRWYTNRIYKIDKGQFAVTFFDITKRKNTEEALQNSEQRFRSLVTASSEVLYRMSPDWSEMIQLNGFDFLANTETPTVNWIEKYIHPDDHLLVNAAIDDAIKNRSIFQLEHRVRQANGDWGWTFSRAVPIIDERGEIIEWFGAASDFTQRKQTEEALLKNEQKYRLLYDSTTESIVLYRYVLDNNEVVDFIFEDINKATEQMTGMNKDNFVGKRFTEVFGSEIIHRYLPAIRQMRSENKPASYEDPDNYVEPLAKYFLSLYVPLDNERFFASSIDITERKKAETAIRESEERFHTLADNISQLAWMADVHGSIFWYNKRWYDYTGTTFEDMKGWGWIKVHHPDHMNRVVTNFKKAIDNGENWEDTFPIRGKDNNYRWYLSRALPIRDENNKIIRWFGTNTDITEQKLAEEKLHAALLQAEEGRNTLNALMEYIPLGITIADAPDVNIRMVSKYGQEILEKPSDEIAGIPAPEHPSKWGIYKADGMTPGLPEELPLSRATLNGEIVKNEEWFVTRKDGTLVPILCNAAPILNNEGNVVGGIIGWQDIADLKKIEQEMRLRNEELTRFIYTVSHDLKSPLVTIKMFTTYLRDDIKNDDKENQQKDLRYVENATDKMGRLLDELLELSRIGRKEQFKTEVMLKTIVLNAIDLVAGRINEKNINVVITAPPILLYGFHLRLIQLFQNLLDNAAKFMGNQPEPCVEIGAFTEKNNDVVLFVRDNGSGIDPRYHDKLFGLFEKLDPATEGTGIGLALVKRIVEVHQGRIWFTSEGLGKGTTFYFTLEKTKLLNS